MRSSTALFAFILALSIGLIFIHQTRSSTPEEMSSSSGWTFIERDTSVLDALTDPYYNWRRPPGPIRVGLQAGHWKNGELPDEFQRLRESGGGATAGGTTEWEVNLEIAEQTAEILRQVGIEVDILPATIPPDYWADVFVSIHADGNENTAVSGYKIAASRYDRTDKAQQLSSFIEEEYGEVAPLDLDPSITRNMRGYYAFNWRRYEHSIHPMVPAAIIEAGFLTNPRDRAFLTQNNSRSAAGIANGILEFLKANPPSTSD